MRIGFVTGEYPPMRGGMGDYTRALGQALVTAGHDVFVLTDRRGAGDSSAGITVEPLIPIWDVASLVTIRRWAIRHQLDVINVQFETAAYSSLLSIHFWPVLLRGLNMITVTTYHDLIAPHIIRFAGRLRNDMLWMMARQSRGCIVTNAIDSAQLRKAVPGTSIAEIPIGSNISTEMPPGYTRDGWRLTHGMESATFLIGYFGFINPQKGLDLLIDGLAQAVHDGLAAQLIIIGGETSESDLAQATYITQIKTRIAATGLSTQVRWTGFLAAPEVSAWLTACDLVALPFADGVSLRRGTFMAALAHGCPILTTAPANPFPELESVACLIPTGDMAALSARLRDLAADPIRRAELGRQAKRFAEHFSWPSIASQTLTFYEKLRH